MKRLLGTLCLATTLALPLAARADEAADKLAIAKAIVDKTVLKTLDLGFGNALEKAVSQMPDDKKDKVRNDSRETFTKERQTLLDGLAGLYADTFSLSDLKQIQGIYDNPVYQKFQSVNSDPKSPVNVLSQATVTRLLAMLTQAQQAGEKGTVTGPGGAPGMRPMQMPQVPK